MKIKFYISLIALLLLFQALSYVQGSDISLSNAAVKIDGQMSGDYIGYKVWKLGDIDNDGLSDFAISSINPTITAPTGRVGIFFGRRERSNWPTHLSFDRADIILTGETAGDKFGEYVSGDGDINGDGYKDIAIGAPCNGETAFNAGKVYLLLGRSRESWTRINGPVINAADIMLIGERRGDQAGPVTLCGDFNHDGLSDLAIGAPGYDRERRWEDGTTYANWNVGKVYLFFGNTLSARTRSTISLSTADRSLAPENNSSFREYSSDFCLFGKSLTFVGDINGDRIDDLVVGAPDHREYDAIYYHEYLNINEDDLLNNVLVFRGDMGYGKIFIFLGNEERTLQVNRTIVGDFPRYYPWLGVAGFITHDPRSVAYVSEARPYYFDHRFTDPYAETVAARTAIGHAGSFGDTISKLGDINHDGCDDFLVGYGFRGHVVLFMGSRSLGILNGLRISRIFDRGTSSCNPSISGGDINGDGYVDILLGIPTFLLPSLSTSRQGEVNLILGGRDWPIGINGIEAATDIHFTSEAEGDYAGYSVAAVGDIDGDQKEDIVIGAYGHNEMGRARSGRSYVIFGGELFPSKSSSDSIKKLASFPTSFSLLKESQTSEEIKKKS